MADSAKHAVSVSVSDFKSLLPAYKTRRTVAFLYGFMFASLLVTVFFAFSPSSNAAAPWLTNVFANGGSSGYRSQVSSIVSYLFPNSTSDSSGLGFVPGISNSSRSDDFKPGSNASSFHGAIPEQSVAKNQTVQSTTQLNQTGNSKDSDKSKVSNLNLTRSSENPEEGKISKVNQTTTSSGNSEEGKNSKLNQTTKSGNSKEGKEANQTRSPGNSKEGKVPESSKNQTQSLNTSSESNASKSNQTAELKPEKPKQENQSANSPKSEKTPASNGTAVISEKKKSNGTSTGTSAGQGMNRDDSIESLSKCDLFDGAWVRDDSLKVYYKPGSCSLVDEQFNCVINGRPDLDYQKFKWKPKGCSIPRIDGKKMLEMLRGKRLVFVGDSLNRNMWESLICILMNSVKDRSKVYEVHGHHKFRIEAEYSFVFQDYKFTVEFYVTPFLVMESDVLGKNGAKKETLRLDLMSKSATTYKNADIIVFNTGHWWTHEKTSKGEDYYQEGDKVIKQLNVLEAFRKAMTTWGKWVDRNINPKKSLLFFRGYSHSHFSGGQWNAGGGCDSETVPIMNETFLRPYLKKMTILEQVLSGMKTKVNYLNVTKMTDFRKDGHPSIYRRQNAPEEEKKSPLKYQDCSHWCLPGVPDTWNEVLYAKMLVKFGGQNKT